MLPRSLFVGLCLACGAVLPLATAAEPFDVVIRGGRVVDGTGAAWYYGDVGVRSGMIAAIGDLSDAEAAEVVDASAFADMTFPTVLALAIEEGCVGETLAAYEAQAALGCVTQPTLQHVLGVIARDEAEHAALAYRFARWGLTAGGSAARGIVDAAFHRAVTRAQDPSQEDDALQQLADEDQNADWLRVHGQRSSLARAQARRRALVEVIEPACRDLLRAAPASHPSSDRATR